MTDDLHTWERGPSDPPSLLDGPGTAAEIEIDARPHEIWPYIVDVNFPATFSSELQRAAWDLADAEPEVGATFTGTNENSFMGEWDVTCHVVECEPNRCFAWATSSAAQPGATWRYELEASGDATRLRHSVVIGPGPSGLKHFVESKPDRAAQIIAGRMSSLRDNMEAVLAGIKAAVES